jgi:hypothetical protein
MTPEVLMKIPLPAEQAMSQMLGLAGNKHAQPLPSSFNRRTARESSHCGSTRKLPPPATGSRIFPHDSVAIGISSMQRLLATSSRKKPGNSVSPVMDRKDAGVVLESQLGENFQGPQRIRANGKLCRSVPANRLTDEVFQHLLATTRIFLKLFAG